MTDIPEDVRTAAEPSEAVIESMCLTMRHDFGLDAVKVDTGALKGTWLEGAVALGFGMDEAQRSGLRLQMHQLWGHHVEPAIVKAILAERARCATIAEGWYSNDIGNPFKPALTPQKAIAHAIRTPS